MQPESKVNILLVDDNPNNLLALEAILNRLEQNLVRATSGKDALRCLLRQDFAVILLDVKMPEMDGFETATLIRERERSRDVPIIFLTAYSRNEQQAFQGYALGAVDYLVKPLDPEILLSKVAVFVELFKKTDQIKQQAAQIAQLNAQLELRVKKRTAELEAANLQKDDLLEREQSAREVAEAAEQRFKDLVNGLDHAIFWEANANTLQFSFVSQSSQMLLGYPSNNWLQKPDFWVNLIHPDEREEILKYRLQQITQGLDHEIQYRCISANDQIVWLRDKAYLVRDEDGTILKIRGLLLDITDAKEAETALRTHADELTYLTTALTQSNILLEKRNKELDQFVYAASHDLKSPLRAIANIAQWIIDDLEGQITAETRTHLELLQGRVYRMENLIDGLLQYYRVGRSQMSTETVDVEQLLKEVIDNLAPQDHFTIEITSPMPTFSTVKLLLQQVFTNLISNSIKHHDGVTGIIRIMAQQEGNFYKFSVVDDGPGIDPQFHEKIFGLFQTLEPHSSHNTGIGLALVKKIVDGEKGNIKVDSQEGSGTTIHFTWPV
ncbi:hybrid sensor histidine kinase/response regulator [Aphanothece hegewaldii CCALA 016]|uniref:histidine kinase n=1 Tax=Aphanothece hegewaldii CCALA 016 TaxID=2107694 RepID=A0A2T1LVY8_9CHRO|nr:response regulator [Aphanothece hegewaldii]PSF36014.1 hybrid sensor histidine kinase/response regulator [Aphanothece hegewaldii CCALA 016]